MPAPLLPLFRLARGDSTATTSWVGSYYNSFFASELKPLLDTFAANEQPILVPPSGKAKSPNTIYQMISQSWHYLIKHDDSDGKYGALRRRVSLAMSDEGVTLKLKKRKAQGSDYSNPLNGDWLEKLIALVERGEGRFERNQIDLSVNDIALVNRMLSPLAQQLVYEVSRNRLIVEYKL